jgi:glycosyltransferase involved in cell wall biosynthesis
MYYKANKVNQRVAIIIPAYNEAKYIGEIIEKCKKYSSDIIVIDDGSSDNTVGVALAAGAIVHSQLQNYGWGYAVQTGLEECRRNHYREIIITLDADGQHDPDDIPLLINEMNKSKSSIVIGSRFKMNGREIGKIPAYRKFGIGAINLVYNFGRKNKLTDTQSGFRAHRNDESLDIKIEERGFAFSTERLIKTDMLGFKISEVAISRIYHPELSENSSMNPILHGLQVAFKTLIWRIRVEFLRGK